MSNTIHDLAVKMRACRLCTDLELGPRPVFQLESGVRILIVGQAPGRLAHHANRPFDDPSGDRLRSWMGVEKQTFYQDPRIGIFPMGLCFPGTGGSGDHPPRAICAQTWRAPVMDALGKIDLTLVLGRFAMAWHLPQTKGLSIAETVKTTTRDDVFVLPHPSPRNNRWLKQNDWFEANVVPRLRAQVTKVLS